LMLNIMLVPAAGFELATP